MHFHSGHPDSTRFGGAQSSSGGFESVEGLKVYNRDFAQTRELTFALVCQPEDADKLEEFAPVFAERLRKQPWCKRVLAGSPMETPEGVRDLHGIAVPLLLNLEPQTFDETLRFCIRQKFRSACIVSAKKSKPGLRGLNSNSRFDPLGLVAPALKPFAGNASIEEEQPLTSPDRTTRVFLAVTNQKPSMPLIASI